MPLAQERQWYAVCGRVHRAFAARTIIRNGILTPRGNPSVAEGGEEGVILGVANLSPLVAYKPKGKRRFGDGAQDHRG